MRVIGSAGFLAALVVVQSALPVLSAATEPQRIRAPDGEPPAILDVVPALDGLTAVALGPAGNSVAVALAQTKKKAEIRLYAARASQPMSVTVAGEVRDLLFTGDGRLYGLLHKPAKKGQGETGLILIETELAKVRHLMRMPPTARALDGWIRQDAVIIACRDELRTVLVPDIRSGPLYRVPGDNRAVAVLGAGDHVLIAQQRELIRVNLADPPQEYEIPVRERADTPEPIESLAASRDGRRALARAASGRLYTVDLEPLVLRLEGGSAVALAAPPRLPVTPNDQDAVDVMIEAPQPAALPPAPQVEPPPPDASPVETEPPAVEASVATGAAAAAFAEKAEAPSSGEPAATDSGPSAGPPASGSAPTVAEAPQRPETTPPPGTSDLGSGDQIQGRITGPAADQVEAVVIMGPDNILHEAARVRPATDGTWSVGGLDPGRYRVQLAAADGRVLVTDPPFAWLEVEAESRIHAPEIRVLRKL